MSRRQFASNAAVLLLIGWATIASAQTPDPPRGRLHATREELQQLLASYEQSARSGAYSAQLRARARYEASLIKQRLEQGDFQVGDRIALTVDGEPTLSDTLIVGQNLSVNLSSGDSISLRQVLRSEVQGRLEQAVARLVKNPVVRTESFLRIGILGAVGAQGFYVVRSEALLTDVLMSAGGISQAADITKMRVERDKQKIWEGEPLQDAITEGRTVDQLSLRAGDLLIVPQQTTTRNMGAILRAALFAIPALFGMIRMLGL